MYSFFWTSHLYTQYLCLTYLFEVDLNINVDVQMLDFLKVYVSTERNN